MNDIGVLVTLLAISCGVWLFSAIATFALCLRDSQNWKRHSLEVQQEDDKDAPVHDGSSLVTGAVIALFLGPIGLVFYALDRMK